MKKIILTVAAVFAFGFANAQDDGGFKVGAHVGFPMGDAGDFYTLNVGLDLGYMWNVGENFNVGVATGYTMYMGDEMEIMPGLTVDVEDAGFVPVAAAGQYNITENIFLGLDLGYALYVGSEDGGEGGLYYQPKVGYSTSAVDIFVGYKGISNDGEISSIGIGAAYKF